MGGLLLPGCYLPILRLGILGRLPGREGKEALFPCLLWLGGGEGGYFVLRECGFVRLGFPGVAEGETWNEEVLVHVTGDSLLLLCHILTSPTDTETSQLSIHTMHSSQYFYTTSQYPTHRTVPSSFLDIRA